MIRTLAIVLACYASTAHALELDLVRNARETASVNSNPDSYFAPFATYSDDRLAGVTVKGAVRRSAFRIDTPGLTPLQLLDPLRIQLEEAGYAIIFDCADVACGGFDFRFAIEVLPAPDMYVNLRNFHFLTAIEGEVSAPQQVVTLLASTAAAVAHLQIIQAGLLGEEPDQFTRDQGLIEPEPEPFALPISVPNDKNGDLRVDLLIRGQASLPDLDFRSGSAELGDGPFDSLALLARVLIENPELRVAVVGHTDNVGGLEPNTQLSRERAASVRAALIDTYGIAASRIEAAGVGYLAPVATNTTEEGRSRNRRVEVVLLQDASE